MISPYTTDLSENMGLYVNKGNCDFSEARNSDYIDKTGLIAFINRTLSTNTKMTCVSRARRFGKSLALQMLYAYYDQSCDSHSLFDDLAIAGDSTYEQHLNKYITIHLDISAFITGTKDPNQIVSNLEDRLIADVKNEYPDVPYTQWNTVMDVLLAVALHTGQRFIMLIDEWDAICRESSNHPHLMTQYMNLLRNLFKSDNTNRVFAGVYMTGILPIKSYGTQSALNNFRMYSMTNPEPLESFFGFTEDEVVALSQRHNLDADELLLWYNGYQLGDNRVRIFNPTSVMTVVTTRICKGYWAQTESFESVRTLINMNFDGVKEALEQMLAQQPTKVTVSTFGNDSNVINSKDELLTLLIHYGYLGYDSVNHNAYIPNLEVRQELLQAIKNGNRKELVRIINDSESLLDATINGNSDVVAHHLEQLHDSNCAPQFYNNEQALRSLIHLAYIAAIDEYVKIQELPTGKGYADVVFVPRRGSSKPAMIVELKHDKAVVGAIAQIRNQNYPQLVTEFTGSILLVGISYSRTSKKHTCVIERIEKTQGVVKEFVAGDSRSSQGVVKELSWSARQQEIIDYCTEPHTLEEIAFHLNVVDRYYLKRKHINPMLGKCLYMTDPDTPTSPTQRYYTKK